MNVVIIGAGGHGKVVLDILRAQKRHKAIAFLDADPALSGTRVCGLPVLGAPNLLPRLRARRIAGAIVAIGDNKARLDYAAEVQRAKLKLISAVHPRAVVSSSATLGPNSVVAAGAVICVEAKIGHSAIINTSAVVDHECEVGDGVHVCPGARLAGRVRVGSESFVGMGAAIIQCVTVGKSAVIGAGAVVIRDVPDGSTVVGVPGKIIRQ